MKFRLKRLTGTFNDGFALDKHMASSTFLGKNEYGHPMFDNNRTPAGEAVYQLKYRNDFSQVKPLARSVVQGSSAAG